MGTLIRDSHAVSSKTGVKEVEGDESHKQWENESETAVSKHGEHGTIVIKGKNFTSSIQQEYNPVSKSMQQAFD